MIRVTFTVLNIQNGKRQKCSQIISRNEVVEWIDQEGKIKVVNGKIVSIVNLQIERIPTIQAV